LRRTVRRAAFEIRSDTDFESVIRGCAAPAAGRPETWINAEILRLNRELFEKGYAHTVECWRDGRLVGGLYGIAVGSAFFGESMFSLERDASKVALTHLVLRLRLGDFRLLDTQFVTAHLQRFGAIEVSRAEYHRRLAHAIGTPARFYCEVPAGALEAFLQSMTHTS
jgi:leucyl/phenylalanyl-tRNA--protein transferase